MGTESYDSRYAALDTRDSADVLSLILDAQQRGLDAVRKAIPQIAIAADSTAERLRASAAGRLIYIGAGTSARLGVQDGVELLPTFGWPAERLGFVIAGDMASLTRAIEGAEDDSGAAVEAVADQKTADGDVCIAVSASGATPFTRSACAAARERGALTIGIANNPGAPLLAAAEHPILVDSGAEPIAGSTRMTAGTSQKVVLNLLSTLVMIRLGHVYDGLMVDVVATNDKLVARSLAMVCQITGIDEPAAKSALEQAGGHVKLASLIATGLTAKQGRATLERCSGDLRSALKEAGEMTANK